MKKCRARQQLLKPRAKSQCAMRFSMLPQRWMFNLDIGLCPSSVQRGGEGGGQSGPGHLWYRAEAPRQRPGINAGRPNRIWSRTESVYGILVRLLPVLKAGLVKPNPLGPWERCQFTRTDDYRLTVLDDSSHPGNRRDLSPNRELLGTLGELPANQGTGTAWRPQGWEAVGDTIVVRGRESRSHAKGVSRSDETTVND